MLDEKAFREAFMKKLATPSRDRAREEVTRPARSTRMPASTGPSPSLRQRLPLGLGGERQGGQADQEDSAHGHARRSGTGSAGSIFL